MRVYFTPQDFKTFVKFDKAFNSFSFTPKDPKLLGVHSIMVTGIDYHDGAVSQIFDLYVKNPPEFDSPLLNILRVRIGSISKY